MLSAAETVCANSAPIEWRLESPPVWIVEPFEVCHAAQIPFRGLAWGVSLSALLWGSLFLAVRTLWNLWR